MTRVTRFTSAAFGMLMLAGLAYYQGHEELSAGEQGALVGTAVPGNPEQQQIDCENPAALDDQGRQYCESKKSSDESR